MFADAEVQTDHMLKNVEEISIKKPELVTAGTIEHDKLKMLSQKDWTIGFFRVYGVFCIITQEKMNGNNMLNAGTHDMGFKI